MAAEGQSLLTQTSVTVLTLNNMHLGGNLSRKMGTHVLRGFCRSNVSKHSDEKTAAVMEGR